MIYPKTDTAVVRNLNVSISKGEIFGILGPNGAGKTTSVSMLSTTLAPTAGSVVIFGLNAAEHRLKVRRLIGLTPQDIALYPELTARENLNFFGRMYGLKGRILRDRVNEALKLVCLEEKGDGFVRTFSGGMKRRANLAAGILHRPRILFLDEPTVGIDAQSRNMILEKLATLRDTGITMVYTTHYMEEAAFLCNRVAIMDDGKIIAQGSPAQLIAEHPGCADLGAVFLKITGKQLRD